MKKLIIFCLLLIPVFSVAQLELYGKYTNHGTVEPVIDYNGSKNINSKLSIGFFGLVRKSWSQALISISYTPAKMISISSGIGIEHGTNSPRYTASVSLTNDQNTLLILGEKGSGNDNYLYKINLFHQFTDRFSLGASAWRYHGMGPNFRFLIPRLQSTIWVMPAYDFEIKQARAIVGISLRMR